MSRVEDASERKRVLQAGIFFGMSVLLLGYAVSVEKERYVLPGPVIGFCCLVSLGFAFSSFHEAGSRKSASLPQRAPHAEALLRPAADDRKKSELLAKHSEDRGPGKWAGRAAEDYQKQANNWRTPQKASRAETPSDFMQVSTGTRRELELAQRHPPFFADVSSILVQNPHAEESIAEIRNVLPESAYTTPRRESQQRRDPSQSATQSSDFKYYMDNQSTAVDRFKNKTIERTLDGKAPAIRKRF